MKYYCPRKWYRNVAGRVPCDGDVVTDVLLMEQAPYCTEKHLREAWSNRYRAMDWYWNVQGSSGNIEYFRVRKRTPQLVENPHVSLHEMRNPRPS